MLKTSIMQFRNEFQLQTQIMKHTIGASRTTVGTMTDDTMQYVSSLEDNPRNKSSLHEGFRNRTSIYDDAPPRRESFGETTYQGRPIQEKSVYYSPILQHASPKELSPIQRPQNHHDESRIGDEIFKAPKLQASSVMQEHSQRTSYQKPKKTRSKSHTFQDEDEEKEIDLSGLVKQVGGFAFTQ
jgi:hypothetical protein